MKFIVENKITYIEASSEQENFPSSNMINLSLKKKWKSEKKNTYEIKLGVPPNAEAIAIFGVNNIGSMTGEAVTAANYTFYDGVTGYDGVSLYQSNIIASDINWDFTVDDKKFQKISTIDGYELVLTLTDTNYPEVGIITSGYIYENTASNPSPGMSHRLVDYSVIKELSSGSFYIKKRDIVEAYSGQIIFNKDNWLSFKDSIKNYIGLNPTAWWIMDKDEDDEFITFARLESMPTGSRISPDLIIVNFSLIEAL